MLFRKIKGKKGGLNRDLNLGPLAPKARIIPYSSVAERWSCKPKVMSSILIGGKPFFSDFLVKL